MKYISYAISFLILCVISFGVTSAYDQVFPKVKLRYGYSYKFSDTLINDTSYEIKLRKLITTFKDNGDFNGGANPSFPYTQAIRNDNTLNPGEKRQITLSTPWYKVKYHPVKRGGKDIEIIYKTIQQSKEGGTWGPQLTHTEYQPYIITWCGDGVVDNYKDKYTKTWIKEACDPGDPKSWNPKKGESCSNSCKIITTPVESSCTKIDVKPTSGTAPVTSNMSCTGKNANSYKIVVKNGSQVIKTFNSKTATYKFSNSGNYTAQCFVNNTVSSPACKEEITVDPKVAKKYDLALVKKIDGATSGYKVGDIVTFNITVTNQGDITANSFTITDYIPVGLELIQTNGWTKSGNNAVKTINQTLNKNDSYATSISFKILDTAPKTIKNYAEISKDDGNDCDSTPDNTNGNGSGESSDLVDDAIGNGCNQGGDEDDHDVAEIVLGDEDQEYDLALRKRLSASTPGPFQTGSLVTFDIEVINQGDIDANNVEVTDYIPTGLELQDPAWTQSGSTATMIISQVATDAPVVKTITFKILDSAPKIIKNYAEISKDDGNDCDSTPDNTNGNGGGESSDLVDDAIGNGCNQGGDEDDHDVAEIVLGNNVTACTSLSASPTSARNSLTSTLTCTGTNANTYKIEVKDASGNIINTFNNNTAQVTLNTVGSYTASCYVNGENTTPNACVKTLSVTTGGGGGSTYRCNDAIRTVGNTVRCYGNGKVNSFALTCGNDADGNPIRKGPKKYTKDANGRKYAEFDCGSSEAQCYVYDKTVTDLNWGNYSWRGGNQCRPDAATNCGNGIVESGEECDTTQVTDSDGTPVYNVDGTPKLNPFPTSVCYAPGTANACKLRKNGGGGGNPNCNKDGNCVLTWPGNGDTKFGPQKDIIIGHNQNVYDVAGAYPYIYNNSKNDISFKKMCIKEVNNDSAIETNHTNKEICINIGNQMIYAYETLFMIEEKVGSEWKARVVTQYRKDELMGSGKIRPPRFVGDKGGIGNRAYGEGRMVTTVSNDTGGDHYKFYFAGKTNVRVAKPAISTVGGGTSYVKSSDSGNVAAVTDNKSNNFVGASVSSGGDTISSDVEEVENSQTEVIEHIEKEKESITDSQEIIDLSPVTHTSFERYNGLDNVYVKTGNYTLDDIGNVQGMDLENLAKPTTFIIQDGNLVISQNVKSNKNIAFVVRGGDIVIDKDVTEMDGTYITIPKNGNGGAFISEESEKQLVINGSLYGDVAKLVDNRYYISDDTQGLGVGTIVAFGSGLFSKTAPLVTEFTNEYLSSQKIAK